jgi:LacI family transcriptional regulator
MSSNKNQKLRDIANMFGVSTVTVSNAMNGRKNVSKDKARAIRKYADEIGYHPSLLAKSLLKGKTNSIGLCLKCDLTSPWYPFLIKTLQEKIWERGYFLNVFIAHPEINRVIEGVKFFARMQVDALLIGPMGFMDEYCQIEKALRAFDHVIAFDAMENLPLDTFQVDTYHAAEVAVSHLIQKGHRHIGMLGACRKEVAMPDIKMRYRGYIETLQRHGLDVDPALILTRDDDKMTENIHTWLQKTLADTSTAPTAFYCHNDNIAEQAIQSLFSQGISIPDEISVIGTNNHPMAGEMPLGLTSVGFDMDLYTTKIVDLLMDKLSATAKTEERKLFRFVAPPRLFERDTVKNITQ